VAADRRRERPAPATAARERWLARSPSTRGGRYFIYRPPLGLREPSDGPRAAGYELTKARWCAITVGPWLVVRSRAEAGRRARGGRASCKAATTRTRARWPAAPAPAVTTTGPVVGLLPLPAPGSETPRRTACPGSSSPSPVGRWPRALDILASCRTADEEAMHIIVTQLAVLSRQLAIGVLARN